jgi:hypothetical protein
MSQFEISDQSQSRPVFGIVAAPFSEYPVEDVFDRVERVGASERHHLELVDDAPDLLSLRGRGAEVCEDDGLSAASDLVGCDLRRCMDPPISATRPDSSGG